MGFSARIPGILSLSATMMFPKTSSALMTVLLSAPRTKVTMSKFPWKSPTGYHRQRISILPSLVSGVSDTSSYVLSAIDQRLGPTPLTDNVATISGGSTSVELQLAIPEDSNTTGETITLTLSSSNLPSGWTLGSASSPTTWTIQVTEAVILGNSNFERVFAI